MSHSTGTTAQASTARRTGKASSAGKGPWLGLICGCWPPVFKHRPAPIRVCRSHTPVKNLTAMRGLVSRETMWATGTGSERRPDKGQLRAGGAGGAGGHVESTCSWQRAGRGGGQAPKVDDRWGLGRGRWNEPDGGRGQEGRKKRQSLQHANATAGQRGLWILS